MKVVKMNIFRRAYSRTIRFFSAVSNLRNPALWLLNTVSGGRMSSAGETVNPQTATSLAVYFAAKSNISEDVGKLPLITYRRLPNDGKERASDHPAFKMLRLQPNPNTSAFRFKEFLTDNALGWGRGYAEIVRDGNGNAIQLWQIHASRVEPQREGTRIFYKVRDNGNTGGVEIEDRDMFVITGRSGGVSIAQVGAEAIGVGIARQKFEGKFYSNGMHVGGTLKHPGKLKPEAIVNLRESWAKMHQGTKNAHQIAILQEGMEYDSTAISQADAQFIESQHFTIEEIARLFRIPQHKIGHLLRSTFSNIEAQGREYVDDTLMPWLVKWEEEIQIKIFDSSFEFFAEYLVNALLRGDMSARANFYRTLLNLASLSPNDIRRLENLNPNPDPAADLYYMQSNMATLANIAAATPDDDDSSNTSDDDDDLDNDNDTDDTGFPFKTPDRQEQAIAYIESQIPIIEQTVSRFVRKECKAVANSMKKYTKNRYDYGTWLVGFIDSHYNAIALELQCTAETIIEGMKNAIPDIHALALINYCLIDLKDLILDGYIHCFDNDSVMDWVEIEKNRKEHITKVIVDEIKSGIILL